MSQRLWGPEEEKILEKMVGCYSLHQIIEKLNKWHRKKGTGITRSRQAVQKRINRLEYSSIPLEDNMTTGSWAKNLGISKSRLDNYRRFNGLVGVKVSYNRTIVSINQMKDFVEKNPHLLSDVKKDVLIYYFGENIAKKILDHKDIREKRIKQPQPVRRIDNQVIYPSLRTAGKNLCMSTSAVRNEVMRDGWLKLVK